MTTRTMTALALAALLAAPAAGRAQATTAQPAQATATGSIEKVVLPSPSSPVVAVRLLFDAGSIHDPKGKEGLAALTALMIGQAGTAKRSYAELLEALYPMAASIDVGFDREVAVVTGEVHREKLADYTALLKEVVLQPGFSESDFQRNKEQLRAYLTTTLRSTSDELLGLEAIQLEIFGGHPYGHSPAGTVQGLDSITLDDVKRFYRERYTQAGLMLGVAGGYPQGYDGALARDLGALPEGTPGRRALPAAPAVEGRNVTLIDKETASVGIHLGFPLPITRADADWFPLMVANSYLGEHRTFHGRLMQQLRMVRGLNYGDYSYIEFWANPPGTSTPTPNVPRRQQYFSIWIRPVAPDHARFALRNALYELDRLVEQGMTKEEFELTRDFLVNYSKLWAQSPSNRLGFLMDSRFYGTPPYIEEIERRLASMTVEDVNRAVKKYLKTDRWEAVFVTGDAATLAAALKKDDPSPMTYNSKVADEVLEVDKVIQIRKIQPTSVEVVPVAQMFER